MRRVLLTGATGTVGSAIASLLVERGISVCALVRSPARARPLVPAAVDLVEGDVTYPPSVAAALRGCAEVWHAAGLPEQWLPDSNGFRRVNVEGTRNLVEGALATGVERFVYTSTIDVFAMHPGVEFDETVIDSAPKATAYERSKQEADRIVTAAVERGLPARFLHPSGVYGPAPVVNPGVNDFLKRLARGEIPMLLPGGMPVVFASDVAMGHLLASEQPVGARYILSESYLSLVDIARAVVDAGAAAKVPPVLPSWVATLVSEAGEALARGTKQPPLIPRGQLHFLTQEVRPSARRARADLGWTPLAFAEGLARTLAAMRSRGEITPGTR